MIPEFHSNTVLVYQKWDKQQDFFSLLRAYLLPNCVQSESFP